MREDEVRRMVRRVVYRTLGRTPQKDGAPARRLVAEADVAGVERDGILDIPSGALVTPLARQIAMERNVELRKHQSNAPENFGEASRVLKSSSSVVRKTIAVGADHGGYELKETLKRSLAEWGYEIADCGADSTESVDYPDYAFVVAQMVANGTAWRGVMIDGAGIGSCMAANKVPGVRASMCYDQATAVNSREHNNANLLTLGAGLIGTGLAKSILKAWLHTPFGGGRHAKRVDKISDIERRYLRSEALIQG
ncbi:MAG: ribose 5-phosphate isomerase B [Anaerolineales bacterium]